MTKKFIPFEKLSKRKQRELNSKKRSTWRIVNPVTRKTKNAKIYDRKRCRNGNMISFLHLLKFYLNTWPEI